MYIGSIFNLWVCGQWSVQQNVKKEEESVRMEQRFNTITRNYSRKEGPEMFSLTLSRQVEVESTFQRQRVENLIVLFDVEMQILMEMMNIEFITKDFYDSRMKVFVKMFKGFVTLLEREMESGKLTRFQVSLNDVTLDEVYARVGHYFEADRRELDVKFSDDVVEDVYEGVVEEPKKVVIEMPVEQVEESITEPITETITEPITESVEEESVVAESVKEETIKEEPVKEESTNEFKEASEGAKAELDKKLADLDLDGFDL